MPVIILTWALSLIVGKKKMEYNIYEYRNIKNSKSRAQNTSSLLISMKYALT